METEYATYFTLKVKNLPEEMVEKCVQFVGEILEAEGQNRRDVASTFSIYQKPKPTNKER